MKNVILPKEIGNDDIGSANKTEVYFEVLTKATLTVDGKNVVKKDQLVLHTTGIMNRL